jgi:hypothetical protein
MQATFNQLRDEEERRLPNVGIESCSADDPEPTEACDDGRISVADHHFDCLDQPDDVNDDDDVGMDRAGSSSSPSPSPPASDYRCGARHNFDGHRHACIGDLALTAEHVAVAVAEHGVTSVSARSQTHPRPQQQLQKNRTDDAKDAAGATPNRSSSSPPPPPLTPQPSPPPPSPVQVCGLDYSTAAVVRGIGLFNQLCASSSTVDTPSMAMEMLQNFDLAPQPTASDAQEYEQARKFCASRYAAAGAAVSQAKQRFRAKTLALRAALEECCDSAESVCRARYESIGEAAFHFRALLPRRGSSAPTGRHRKYREDLLFALWLDVVRGLQAVAVDRDVLEALRMTFEPAP